MATVSEIIDRLCYLLNAEDAAHLTYWSSAELADYAVDALQKLSRVAAAWPARDTRQTSADTAAYTLPEGHLGVVHVSLDGVALRPANMQELDALGAATGPTKRWAADWQGFDSILLSPAPEADQALAIVTSIAPADATGAWPAIVDDYLELSLQADARGRDGDGAMPEAAAWCRAITGLIERAAAAIWGPSL